MTTVDVLYRYAAAPAEDTMIALNKMRDVYGIRRIDFSESAHTVRVEYDASRLSEPVIRGLLGRAGLNIAETLSTLPPQPAPEPTTAQ